MTRGLTNQAIIAIFVLAIQLLLLKNVQVPIFDRFSVVILIYPIILLLLPLGFSRYLMLLLAFVIGLMVDMFYDSPGVHSAAFVFTAFARSYVLKIIEPRGGYRIGNTPSARNYTLSWSMGYLAIMLFMHLLIYFGLDAFSIIYLGKILVNSIISFVFSYVCILLIQFLTNQ